MVEDMWQLLGKSQSVINWFKSSSNPARLQRYDPLDKNAFSTFVLGMKWLNKVSLWGNPSLVWSVMRRVSALWPVISSCHRESGRETERIPERERASERGWRRFNMGGIQQEEEGWGEEERARGDFCISERRTAKLTGLAVSRPRCQCASIMTSLFLWRSHVWNGKESWEVPADAAEVPRFLCLTNRMLSDDTIRVAVNQLC